MENLSQELRTVAPHVRMIGTEAIEALLGEMTKAWSQFVLRQWTRAIHNSGPKKGTWRMG